MKTTASGTSDAPTDDFESALQALVLDAFASGTTVQGTWEIAPSESVVPSWRVTIERLEDADPPEGTATFLDE